MRGSGWICARGLPDIPLDAAAEFHARIVPDVRQAMARSGDIVICFDPADHAHKAWRLAAIQNLAREGASGCRVNGLVASSSDLAGTAETRQFLQQAAGVTGQLLEVAGNGAEKL